MVAVLVASLTAGCTSGSNGGTAPTSGSTSEQPSSPTPTGLTSVTDLARGPAPNLPYWLNGYLHLGSRQVAMPYALIFSSGGTSLVVSSPPTGSRRIYVVEDERLVALQTAETDPVISSDGHYAAWETPPSGSLAAVVLWDLSTGQQVASQRFRSHQHCCDAPSLPVGIDARGSVYIWDGGVPLAWNHADQRVEEITGVAHTDLLGNAYLGGAMFLDTANEHGRSRFGPLDAAYTFRPIGSMPSQDAVWSPDGQRAAYRLEGGAPAVLDLATTVRTRLHLPEADYVVLAWETPTQVLFSTDVEGATYWIRCDALTGDCQVTQIFSNPGRLGVELPKDG